MPFWEPKWIEQGPGPAPGSGGAVSGAVQAIATDPVNPSRVFVGAASGGVWRTTNALAASPSWEPLTDQAPSLSISCLALSPLDPTSNTLFAGLGGTSSGSPVNGINRGPLLGILATSDGGGTWRLLGKSTFAGLFITRILPTPVQAVGGGLIFVTAAGPSGGVFRSQDGGQTWERRSGSGGAAANGLPDTSYWEILGHPGTGRLYTAGGNPRRAFQSDDMGDQWVEIAIPPNPVAVSISPATDNQGEHWIYLIAQAGGIFVSRDSGVTWTMMDAPPDGGKFVREVVASPDQVNIVFANSTSTPGVASSRTTHWRGNANAAPGAQWYEVDGVNAGGTFPHTDARGWVFSADHNVMFECNDGGISRFSKAMSNSPLWESAVGNMRVTEFLSIAYDSVNHIIFGACWDNSIPQQTTKDDIDWEMNEDSYGDGMQVGVDCQSIPGQAVHYSSQQNAFRFRRRTYSSPTTVVSDVEIPPIIDQTGGRGYNDVEGALTPNDPQDLGTVRWRQTWAVNRADGKRLLLGTDYLYESFNRGDLFTSLGGIGANINGEPIPINPVGTVTAYAYGHTKNPDVIYVGTKGNAGGKLLWVRASGKGAPGFVDSYVAAGGSVPWSISLDPNDWQRAYVLDSAGRVWRTVDAGATDTGWTDLTGSLSSKVTDLRTIEACVPPFRTDRPIILVGGFGGVFIASNPGVANVPAIGWRKYGVNLPNVIVTDLHYDANDRVLVVGTYGRGAWKLRFNHITKVIP